MYLGNKYFHLGEFGKHAPIFFLKMLTFRFSQVSQSLVIICSYDING